MKKLGRHPLLKVGTRCHEIYIELQKAANGEALDAQWKTQSELARTLGYNPNGMLQRMKAAGLVQVRAAQKGNRTIKQYAIVSDNVTGSARDVVGVHVTVYVNDYGEYSAVAHVTNQLDTALTANPQAVATQEFTIAVPKPDEPYRTREMFSPGFGLYAPTCGSAKKGEIIDLEADYIDITSDRKPEQD